MFSNSHGKQNRNEGGIHGCTFSPLSLDMTLGKVNTKNILTMGPLNSKCTDETLNCACQQI